MNGYIKKLLDKLVRNFGRPSYDLGSDDKIHEAEDTVKELNERRRELERRQRLLEIQGTPRGMHGR